MGYYRRAPLANRRRLIIIGLSVIAVIGLGVLRYYSPYFTARSFLTSVYARNYGDAIQQVCPAQRDQFNQAFRLNKLFDALIPTSIDASKLTYGITQESLSNATITATGTYRTFLGDTTLNGSLNLEASGLGWCITGASGT